MTHIWVLGINSPTTTKKKFPLTAGKPVCCNKRSEASEAVQRQQQTENLHSKREKTIAERRKVIYRVSHICYEKIIPEYIQTMLFSNKYIHFMSLNHFQLRFRKVLYTTYINFQTNKFFTQKKSAVCTVQSSNAWSEN